MKLHTTKRKIAAATVLALAVAGGALLQTGPEPATAQPAKTAVFKTLLDPEDTVILLITRALRP